MVILKLEESEVRTIISALHIAFGFDFEELEDKIKEQL